MALKQATEGSRPSDAAEIHRPAAQLFSKQFHLFDKFYKLDPTYTFVRKLHSCTGCLKVNQQEPNWCRWTLRSSVTFRYTEKEGLRLGLVGWVKNTYSGTVVGQVQGPADMVEEMKVWLSKEGSPTSRITRASFTNQRAIDKLELSGFKTRF
ncbi:acylphosphatase-2-like isoform X3 [Siniperca chuatsi]|uniref:acylphosphatase-2-like isoform X3 n=1 Tax=Siniperca chuatsi TaxID=119488 RepID=UPI001CE07B18|nr:acylphosphatase-2-like isoform X3 [Siniperca chuatsi]